MAFSASIHDYQESLWRIHILVFYVDRAHCFYKILNVVDGLPKQVLEELN